MRDIRLLGLAIVVLLTGGVTAATHGDRDDDQRTTTVGPDGRTAESPAFGPFPATDRQAPGSDAPSAAPSDAPASPAATEPSPPDAVAGGSPGTRPPASPSPPRAGRTLVEAGDAPLEIPAVVAAGHYTLRATLTGAATRAQLTLDGRRVAEVGLAGAAYELAVPVWITGPEHRVGVTSLAGPVRVERLRLEPGAPAFTTVGADILDRSGTKATPRGVNSFVLADAATGDHFNEPDVAGMASWGSTIVRVQLGQQLLLSGLCEHDPTYLSLIDERVRWITERGMIALLDLHRVNAGDPCGNANAIHEAPDRFSPTFWQIVADRYKGNPLVAFDLYNEPNGIPPEVWRDGGTITEPARLGRPERTWEAVGMQRLYDTVRATGARNLVFISGTSYAGDLRPHVTHPIDGWGIVAATHLYCDDCGGALHPLDEVKVAAASERLPVVVTEFGFPDDRGTYNANLIRWAEGKGFGWVAHAWAVIPNAPFGLLRSWDTNEPSANGLPVREGLLAAQGR